ncbi:MAG TPA: hypothetical protein VFQ44_31300 [Streptosporangiaceae bacterium]|nr:hypothetical protein [Streptosporangiaceae bacterium]
MATPAGAMTGGAGIPWLRHFPLIRLVRLARLARLARLVAIAREPRRPTSCIDALMTDTLAQATCFGVPRALTAVPKTRISDQRHGTLLIIPT